MHIVAHSMGGLVARGMLNRQLKEARTPTVRLFVSLSTPWGGIDSTTRGVRESPFIIPVWIDLQPQGRYLGDLYDTALKPRIEFHLFYGHRSSRFAALDDDKSDGTVTVESQLDANARNDAVQVVGFEEDHESILKSRAVIAALNQVLRRADGAASTASSAKP
jgi:pimeloyl-ACP methyl ester carboxylesterase